MGDFKKSINAQYPFIADPEGTLINLFDVKYPFVTIAKRVTFIIGKNREILKILKGKEALDPKRAIQACQGY